jgi:hypothetical protein
MNVIDRLALGVTATALCTFPCRAALALEPTSAESPAAAPAPTESASIEDAPPDASRDTPNAPSEHKETKRTDHFRIGALGGIGFPRPLEIEGMVKLENLVGLGVEYSALPGLTIDSVDTHFWAVAADVRLFPFKNAFFVGLKAGRQHLGGDANVTVTGYGSLHEAVAVDTTFVNPRLGFLWTWDPGVSLGIDIGVQVPVSTASSSSLPPGVNVTSDVTRVTNSLGRYALPTIDLLRVGVLL